MGEPIQDLRKKLHKAIEEIDLNDASVLESVSAGAVDVTVCGSGCIKVKD